nr:anthocyanidin 3-O-glucosyltransferase [Ipomoea trifida]
MGSSECHIAVLAFPFTTHAAPLLSLVEQLSAALPSARFSFFNNHDSNSTLFGGRSPAAGKVKAYDVWDGTVAGEALVTHEEFIMAMPGNYQTAIAEAEAEMGTKFGCFLTDSFLWFGGDLAAERGGVPWISFWTAGACSISAHLYTDFVRSLVAATPNANGKHRFRFMLSYGIKKYGKRVGPEAESNPRNVRSIDRRNAGRNSCQGFASAIPRNDLQHGAKVTRRKRPRPKLFPEARTHRHRRSPIKATSVQHWSNDPTAGHTKTTHLRRPQLYSMARQSPAGKLRGLPELRVGHNAAAGRNCGLGGSVRS